MLERNWYNTRDGRGGRLREPIEYGECPIWSEDPSLAERMSTEDICEMYWLYSVTSKSTKTAA